MPGGLNRAQVGHDRQGDPEDQDVGQARHQHQLAWPRLALEDTLIEDPLVEVVAPVARSPVEMGVDGRGEGGQKPRQHQSLHSHREEVLDPGREQDLAAGGEGLAAHLACLIGVDHQERDADRQPEQ